MERESERGKEIEDTTQRSKNIETAFFQDVKVRTFDKYLLLQEQNLF